MRSARTTEPTSLKSHVAANAVATTPATAWRSCRTTAANGQWVKQMMSTENRPQLRHAQRTQVDPSVVTHTVTQAFQSTGPKMTTKVR